MSEDDVPLESNQSRRAGGLQIRGPVSTTVVKEPGLTASTSKTGRPGNESISPSK